jgi:hypothetical protein
VRRTGTLEGMPCPGRDREIGAPQMDPGEEALPGDDREIGALQTNPGGDPLLWRDQEIGAPQGGGRPKRLRGVGRRAMLDNALSGWGALDGKVAKRHRVFDRDGWRCAVPGCTSMQNLHDRHIRFRSAGARLPGSGCQPRVRNAGGGPPSR